MALLLLITALREWLTQQQAPADGDLWGGECGVGGMRCRGGGNES